MKFSRNFSRIFSREFSRKSHATFSSQIGEPKSDQPRTIYLPSLKKKRCLWDNIKDYLRKLSYPFFLCTLCMESGQRRGPSCPSGVCYCGPRAASRDAMQPLAHSSRAPMAASTASSGVSVKLSVHGAGVSSGATHRDRRLFAVTRVGGNLPRHVSSRCREAGTAAGVE